MASLTIYSYMHMCSPVRIVSILQALVLIPSLKGLFLLRIRFKI